MLNLHLDNRARRFVEKLPPKQAGQISRKILELRKNPLSPDSKLVKSSIYRRADIGEYRIVYRVVAETLYVPIIGKRNDDEVYRRLKRLFG